MRAWCGGYQFVKSLVNQSKFLGVGEKTEALEPFHPDRVASRILGMGDVLSLIEDLERSVDREKAEKMAQKFKKGDDFTLDDFREQLIEMKKWVA